MKSLIVVYSYHHKNTQKVADAMAEVLQAEVKSPQDSVLEEIQSYDIVGFGSGIDSGKNYVPLLEFAEELPVVQDKRAFLFSTSSFPGERKMKNDHSALREILLSKGYKIDDEFHCQGFNTNSILRYFGGINKGRPNSGDLAAAHQFAQKLNYYY